MNYTTEKASEWIMKALSKEKMEHTKIKYMTGPAVEYRDNEKRWYKNGKFHHLDEPAVITGFLKIEPTKALVCECGGNKCGTPHSDWCPIAN